MKKKPLSRPQYIEVVDCLGTVIGSCRKGDKAKAVALLQTAGVICTQVYADAKVTRYHPVPLESSPSVREVTLAMRKGVQRGLNFYQWRKNLSFAPRLYSETEMQLYYEKLEVTFAPKSPEGEGQYVLLKIGGVADRKAGKFLCFQLRAEAGAEGRKRYGYGNFEIADWQRYKLSADFRAMQRFFQIKAKLNQFK